MKLGTAGEFPTIVVDRQRTEVHRERVFRRVGVKTVVDQGVTDASCDRVCAVKTAAIELRGLNGCQIRLLLQNTFFVVKPAGVDSQCDKKQYGAYQYVGTDNDGTVLLTYANRAGVTHMLYSEKLSLI